MNPIQLGIGAICLAAGVGAILALNMYESPRAQRLVVANAFEDADCSMDFYVEASERFSIRKGATYQRTYKCAAHRIRPDAMHERLANVPIAGPFPPHRWRAG